MKGTPSASVLIFPGSLEKPLLNDVIQAMRLVEAIMAINDDDTIEPGHLCGMSLMLSNAEKVLGEMRSALPALPRRRAPTCDTTAWPDANPAYTAMR